MTMPADLLYSKSHEWIRVEGDEAVMGITHFAQEQLGDITFVDLPAVGDEMTAGGELGAVESVKAASELYSPASGEIIAVNEELDAAPELVNQAPYTEGWMVRIKLSAAPEGLLDAAAYAEHAASEAH